MNKSFPNPVTRNHDFVRTKSMHKNLNRQSSSDDRIFSIVAESGYPSRRPYRLFAKQLDDFSQPIACEGIAMNARDRVSAKPRIHFCKVPRRATYTDKGSAVQGMRKPGSFQRV